MVRKALYGLMEKCRQRCICGSRREEWSFARTPVVPISQLTRPIELVQNPAWFHDARIYDFVVGPQAVAAHCHESGMTKKREVLRDVRFRDFERFDQILYAHFLLPQEVQDFKPLRIRQNLIRFGIFLVCGAGKRPFYFHSF